MGRPSLEAVVKETVRAYLVEAQNKPPAAAPLSTHAVAKAIGRDRRVLKKYGLDVEIDEAAKVQHRFHRSGVDEKRRTLEDRIAEGLEREETLQEQVRNLLARQALLETNMKRHDIDPEELYKPIMPPDRSLPNIFRKRTQSNRST